MATDEQEFADFVEEVSGSNNIQISFDRRIIE